MQVSTLLGPSDTSLSRRRRNAFLQFPRYHVVGMASSPLAVCHHRSGGEREQCSLFQGVCGRPGFLYGLPHCRRWGVRRTACRCPMGRSPGTCQSWELLLLLSRGGHLHFPLAFAGVVVGRTTLLYFIIVVVEIAFDLRGVLSV